MPTTAAPARSKTAEEVLDLAETLIQTRGYSAFSYQDIADALGIRKASIHYHFPSKTDLGLAVVDRYAERFGAALDAIAADTKQSSLAMLDHYAAPYLELAKTPDKVCLCGALAGEMMALPPSCARASMPSSRSTRPGSLASWREVSSAVSSPSRPSPRKRPASFSEPCKVPCW